MKSEKDVVCWPERISSELHKFPFSLSRFPLEAAQQLQRSFHTPQRERERAPSDSRVQQQQQHQHAEAGETEREKGRRRSSPTLPSPTPSPTLFFSLRSRLPLPLSLALLRAATVPRGNQLEGKPRKREERVCIEESEGLGSIHLCFFDGLLLRPSLFFFLVLFFQPRPPGPPVES